MADFDLRITGIDAIKEAMDAYSSSSADFFSISDDGQTAKVRFAHGDDKDLDIYVVHKVQLNGKDRYVACLSPAKIPCPFCKAGLKPAVRLFLTLEDSRDGKKKIWDRGKTEIPNILGLVGRYGRLDGRPYDIQRHGKKGDKETKYQYFPLDPYPAGTPEIKRDPICAENGFILKKSPDEMEAMLPQISAPNNGGNNSYGSQPQGNTPGKMF
jgi:hypothetical protein